MQGRKLLSLASKLVDSSKCAYLVATSSPMIPISPKGVSAGSMLVSQTSMRQTSLAISSVGAYFL
jgi:hypothetical protein